MKRPVSPAFLVVDKPAGLTSHDVVAVVRGLLGARRVGHTGTLDPFATGVLPLAIGPATRLISFLDESNKVYEAALMLGAATETADVEGPVVRTAPVPSLDREHIEGVMAGFVGERLQTPPAYSAVKVNGRPLYAYARAGESVEVPARPIVVHSMLFLGLSKGVLKFRVACGRGTYVRVLGEELAVALGTVGHLIALRRLRSGPFELKHSVGLDELARVAMGAAAPIREWGPILRPERGAPRVQWQARTKCREEIWSHVLPPEFGFSQLPVQSVTPALAERVLACGTCPHPPETVHDGSRYIVADSCGMLALVERQGGAARTLRVLARPPVPAPAPESGVV